MRGRTGRNRLPTDFSSWSSRNRTYQFTSTAGRGQAAARGSAEACRSPVAPTPRSVLSRQQQADDRLRFRRLTSNGFFPDHRLPAHCCAGQAAVESRLLSPAWPMSPLRRRAVRNAADSATFRTCRGIIRCAGINSVSQDTPRSVNDYEVSTPSINTVRRRVNNPRRHVDFL